MDSRRPSLFSAGLSGTDRLPSEVGLARSARSPGRIGTQGTLVQPIPGLLSTRHNTEVAFYQRSRKHDSSEQLSGVYSLTLTLAA